MLDDELGALVTRELTAGPPPAVVNAWRLLHRSRGAVPIGTLADAVGYSDRRLSTLFDAEIGLTPKTAARVIRFDRARRADPGRGAGHDGSDRRRARLRRPVPPRARLRGVQRPVADEVAGRGVRKRPSEGHARRPRLIRMTDNTPAPQVWPTLRARDARALIRFLVDVVGFEETAVYGDGDVVAPRPALLAARRRDHARLRPRGRVAAAAGHVRRLRRRGRSRRPVRAGHGGGRGHHPQAGATPTTAPASSPCATRRATSGRSAPTAANRVRTA